MATLIAVYNSEGCVGRCDAKCYDAEHKECNCICGGRNHGQGHAKALANTHQMGADWIEVWKKKNPDKNETFDVPGKQLGLF